MHIPVLLNELIEMLNIDPAGIYVDCTGGGGGHAGAVLKKLSQSGRLIIMDRDIEAAERLKVIFGGDARVSVVQRNFADIETALQCLNIQCVSGIYADFGVSSFQLSDEARGFSFRSTGRIDMRMDQSSGVPAGAVVNTYGAEQLTKIIAEFGEERFARRIADRILRARSIKPIETTCELAEVIKKAVPMKFHKQGFHPATKTFQALRIFVNDELGAIRTLMEKISKLLAKGGRFAAISFHSLEDRIVKDKLMEYFRDCICPRDFPVCVCGGNHAVFKPITKKPITPQDSEILKNPLSRSAKMRVAERI